MNPLGNIPYSLNALVSISILIISISLGKAKEIENRINEYRDLLRAEHTEAVKQNEYSYQTGISYSTLYAQCEKLADFAINVTEAIDKIKK